VKKVLLAVGALFLLVALAVVGFGVHLVGRVDTPGFQKALLDQATAAVGADVRVREMSISLFSGIALKGLAVANPAPFAGDLLTADAFVLRYRLIPLLAGRVDVERVALERPTLRLVMDARGGFNYERLGGSASRSPRTSAFPAAVPLRVVLKQLAVDQASVVMIDHTKARLMTIEGARFRSAFAVEGGVAQGSGEATIATVNLADLLFLRSVRAPLTLSKQTVKLAPIRGRVAGGEATGDLTVHLQRGFRYVANLEVKDVEARTLLAEAKSKGGMSGALQAKATFEGTGGVETMRGHGQGTVTRCRVEHGRTFALLASVLGVPELADPDFEECRAEFTQSGRRLATPVLRLDGRSLQLRGRGTVDLETGGLDYQMSLALAPKLLAKVTRPELRPAFKDRGDGFSAVAFRLYGTMSDPQTDLLSQVAKAAATEAVKKQLDRLFRPKGR
jgi:AsmA-like C-terminal region